MSTTRLRISHALAVLCLLVFLASPLMAQTAGTGALSGTVTDPTGAVVPNVTVTVTSVDTNQVRTSTTGADGAYKVGLLPPGQYSVKFEAAGFQTTENPNVTVNVTETGTLNQALTVGAQTQEVTVTSDVEAVQTASSTLGTVVKNVADLPLATRNYVNLLGLSAGANGSVNNAASSLGKGTQSFAVNGAAAADNNYQMDGVSIVSVTSAGGVGEAGTFSAFGVPSPDAIQEFKIQTSTYDASYGRNSGASVNVVTRSGTNAYHGTAFEFFRNTVLDANDFFRDFHHLATPTVDQNQYGGTFGGPVKKDRLFFFASYQGTAQKNGVATGGASNPELPYITPSSVGARTGNAWLVDMYNHYCGSAGAVGGGAGVQIEAAPVSIGGTGTCANAGYNAAIAIAPINPVALKTLQLVAPTSVNGTGYYIPSPLDSPFSSSCTNPKSGLLTYSCLLSVPAIQHEYQGVGNWDYVLNSKNTLSGRYFISEEPQFSPFGAGTTALPGEPLNSVFTNHEAVLKLTTILSSNVVNEIRASFQRNSVTESVPVPYTSSQTGMTPVTPNVDILPQENLQPGNVGLTIGTYQFGIALNLANQYQYADQVSMTRGKHTIRFGFEAARYLWQYKFEGLNVGSLTYGGTTGTFVDFLTGLPGCAAANPSPSNPACGPSGVGTGTGTNLNGTPEQTNGTASSSISGFGATTRFSTNPIGYIHHYRMKDFNAFVQDDFKVSQHLTLNLGVRWEWDGEVSELVGENTNIDISRILGTSFPLANGAGFTGTGTSNCAGVVFPTPCSGGSFVGYVAPSNYNASLLGVLPTGVFRSGHSIASASNPPKDDFAPRLGFAWQPLSDNSKFVVRGGAGFFYNRLPGDDYIHTVLQNVPTGYTVGPQFNADEINPYGNTPAGWGYRWVAVNPTSSVITSSGISNAGIEEAMTTPVVYEWSLNIQYEFLPSWVLEVGYVGSRGIHQFTAADDVNAPPLVSAALPPSNGVGAALAAAGLSAGQQALATTNSTTNTGLRVPYPGFVPTLALEATVQDLKYNSLQATVRKQFSHGFTFQAAYTWSRALASSFVGNPNADVIGATPVFQEYGLNTGYHPQRIALNYSWNLPFGHADGLKGKLIEGWVVSGVTVIQDGTPLTVTDSRLGSVFGTVANATAQMCPGATNGQIAATGGLYDKVVNGLNGGTGYFSRAPFSSINAIPSAGVIVNCPSSFPSGPTATGGLANPTPTNPLWANYANGTGYGNEGLGTILGPGQFNTDITLAKTTKVGGLREDATLQFRAEFLNAFNHPQFSNPSVGVNSASYGQITSTTVNPRLIQLALKYQF